MASERSEKMRGFLAGAGWSGDPVPLAGDASTRRYFRIRRGERTAIVMDQPPGAESPACPPDAPPEERARLGYNAMARLAGPDCRRFVAVAQYLRARGLSAPEILDADTGNGFLLIEDLGGPRYVETLAQGGRDDELYGAAIDVLAELHAQDAPRALGPADAALYAYDETALLAEAELLPQWFFPAARGQAASQSELAEHAALWRETLKPVLAARAVFVHRDYHAENLVWLPQRQALARVGLLDFQDALAGHPAYDLVSLLEDARRDVDAGFARRMEARYAESARARGMRIDDAEFAAARAILAAQRNAKIIGIFARLWRRDGKPRYLAHIPRVWGYMERDLEHPALARLRTWYEEAIPKARRRELKAETAAP